MEIISLFFFSFFCNNSVNYLSPWYSGFVSLLKSIINTTEGRAQALTAAEQAKEFLSFF